MNISPPPSTEPDTALTEDSWGGPGRGVAVAIGSALGVLLLCSTIYFIRHKRDSTLRRLLTEGGSAEEKTRVKTSGDKYNADSTLAQLSP